MPVGSRVRANNVFGLVTDNPLGVSSTTLNSNGLSNLPAILAGSQHAVITLDPLRVNGAPEIIFVTNHSSLSTLSTITRGAFGTTARSHPQGTLWTHTPMNEDYISIATSTTRPADPYIGELIYETDTGLYKNWTGSIWSGITGAGLAGGTLASQISALDQTANTGDTLTGLTCTVTVPAGRLLRISASSQVQVSANSNWLVDIFEDGVNIGRLWLADFVIANGLRNEMDGFVLRSPSAGTHTYSFITTRFGGSGTMLIEGTSGGKRSMVEDVTGSATPFNNSSVPVGQIAYSQSLTNIVASTGVDLPGIAINIVVPAARVIKLRAYAQVSPSAISEWFVSVVEGVTEVGRVFTRSFATTGYDFMDGECVITPSAGAHTYKLNATRFSGAGTFNLDAVPTIYLMAEDITPTPSAASGAPSSALAYAEVVANQTGIVAEVDLTGLAVTVNVPSGRRIKITGHVGYFNDTVNGGFLLNIKEGGTVLNRFISYETQANNGVTTHAEAIITPTAGSHTYKLTGTRAVVGTVTMEAGPTIPSFILVEDITGAIWPAGSSVSTSLIASEAWTTYVPTVKQSTSVTNTITYARYLKIGRQVTFQFNITIVGTGVSSNAVNVTIPIAPVTTGGGVFDRMVVGTAQIFDSSANLYYQGLATLDGAGATQLVFYPTNAVGSVGTQFLGLSQFTSALAVGDIITGSVVYESAS